MECRDKNFIDCWTGAKILHYYNRWHHFNWVMECVTNSILCVQIFDLCFDGVYGQDWENGFVLFNRAQYFWSSKVWLSHCIHYFCHIIAIDSIIYFDLTDTVYHGLKVQLVKAKYFGKSIGTMFVKYNSSQKAYKG